MTEAKVIKPYELRNLVKSNTLRFLHLNVHSANNTADDFNIFLSNTLVTFDVIILAEPWYNDDSSYFVLPYYQHFVLSVRDRKGGGVSIQQAPSLTAYELSEYTYINNSHVIAYGHLSRCTASSATRVVTSRRISVR